MQLRFAVSTERTHAVCRQVEEILGKTPGIKHYTTVVGYSLLSGVRNTYSAFFWVTLKEWSERTKPEERFDAIKAHLAKELSRLPTAVAFPISPPASVEPRSGPEFTMRYNLYRSAQINGSAASGYSSAQATAALEDVFAKTMPPDMGYDYLGMSFQEKKAREGVSP